MGMLKRRGELGRRVLKGAGITAGAAGAAALGWIGYSRFAIDHKRRLAPAIDAPVNYFQSSEAGRLAYYADRAGSGTPLVLLHSVNAAASSYEMRPLFEHYRGRRPVFALDLPGFGLSDRGPRDYTPELYARSIVEFLSHVELKADVVALSLTAEFAARAAVDREDRFRSLALISPTGLSSIEHRRSGDAAQRAMQFPLWRQAFYDLLVSRPSLRYFLKKNFAGPVDRGLAQYGYDSAHRPNAHVAPLQFLSGRLFTPDAYNRTYDRVRVPTLVLYDGSPYETFDRIAGILRTNPNWRAERIRGTRGLPHFEQLEQTVRALDRFWTGIAAVQESPALH